MTVRRLTQRRVAKPWGRHALWPGFEDPASGAGPIGEIWFEEPGDPALLVKYLFTSEKLSVQVHPDNEGALARGYPRGKDECWLVLDAEPDATIALGPKAAVTREDLGAAALDGSIVDLLDWRPVSAGDFIHSPAGTVHAIGAGITLIEVQQNVDLTYRLYDYGRPRELHLADGLAVSDITPFALRSGRFAAGRLLDGPVFGVNGLEAGAHELAEGWLIPFRGGGTVGDEPCLAGECWRLDGPARVRLEAGARALYAAIR